MMTADDMAVYVDVGGKIQELAAELEHGGNQCRIIGNGAHGGCVMKWTLEVTIPNRNEPDSEPTS